MELNDAKIGDVCSFDYLQPVEGTTRRHLAKVLEIKKFTEEHIRAMNAKSDYRTQDADFKRTNTLVVCMMPDGKVRNFYAERTRFCDKNLLGRFLFNTGIARFIYR